MNNSLKQKELENQALVQSKEIYKGKVFTIYKETLQFEDQPPHNWDIVSHIGAVAALPILENGNFLLIQQWRRPIRKIIYEIPAGTLDEGEEPEPAMHREIQEEVGYKAKTLIPMGGIYSAPGFCNEYIHLYIAQELEPSSLPKDPHEAIDVVELPLEKALHLIQSGEINDAKTLCAILRYAQKL